jgi:hypothetical protein
VAVSTPFHSDDQLLRVEIARDVDDAPDLARDMREMLVARRRHASLASAPSIRQAQ